MQEIKSFFDRDNCSLVDFENLNEFDDILGCIKFSNLEYNSIWDNIVLIYLKTTFRLVVAMESEIPRGKEIAGAINSQRNLFHYIRSTSYKITRYGRN
jgi:hypothetical protein